METFRKRTRLLQRNRNQRRRTKVSAMDAVMLQVTYLDWTANISQLSLQWHHNGRDGVSNHQPHGCLLNLVFRRRSKKTWKFRVTSLCAGNSFSAQMASNAGNVSIWWLHHGFSSICSQYTALNNVYLHKRTRFVVIYFAVVISVFIGLMWPLSRIPKVCFTGT